MKHIFISFILLLVHSFANGQNSKPTAQSDISLNFNSFLAGVKYAEVLTTPEIETNISKYQVYIGVVNYLKTMGFLYVGFTSDIANYGVKSECEKTIVHITYDVRGANINNFALTFYSCIGEWWHFKNSSTIVNNGYGSIADKVERRARKMYSYKKPYYRSNYQRNLPSDKTDWNEVKLKRHFVANGADMIEGIYEQTFEMPNMPRYKIGVIKNNNEYKMIYLGGASNSKDWIEGEIKADLINTATPTLFKLRWRMGNKKINEAPFATFEPGSIIITWPGRQNAQYIKLFPSQFDNGEFANSHKVPGSGTGFALTSNGLIVTNYHVVNESKNIKVRGIKGDFSKTYMAEVLTVDKKNDLAIITIKDKNFTSLGQIPYTLNNDVIDVGNSVYALGYPMRASMGDEVKLTNGIISSKTGFQGDITTYQVSVPVQPGNSGGPLINERGEIVAIISSKHRLAENASYAIKSSYLMNLLQIMDEPPKIPTNNILINKELSDQVKFIKEFVYIIEVN